MNAKKVLFAGSCWPTNIGNAFVNLGAISLLRKALGETGEVWHVGGISNYLANVHGKLQNNLHLADGMDIDYIVMGGMTQCVAHLRGCVPFLQQAIERGVKIVIAGGGAEAYDEDEVAWVRQFMQELPVWCFISRDRYSFEKYADLAEHSYDGIDSAFFITDHFQPVPLSLNGCVVLNFDKWPEPSVINASNPECNSNSPTLDKSNHSQATRQFFRRLRRLLGRIARGEPIRRRNEQNRPTEKEPIAAEGRFVVRTHHAVMSDTSHRFDRPYTMVSDLPSDYLSLYSHAHITYSDRIHACIATLAFGNRAQLFGKHVPRLRMFERVGVGDILQHPVQLDMQVLDNEKQKQVAFLRDIL